jgi:hypothetical protein
MKKNQIISISIPLILALIFVVYPEKSNAQSISCVSAQQTCYEVFVSGIKVKTVAGKAQIKL